MKGWRVLGLVIPFLSSAYAHTHDAHSVVSEDSSYDTFRLFSKPHEVTYEPRAYKGRQLQAAERQRVDTAEKQSTKTQSREASNSALRYHEKYSKGSMESIQSRHSRHLEDTVEAPFTVTCPETADSIDAGDHVEMEILIRRTITSDEGGIALRVRSASQDIKIKNPLRLSHRWPTERGPDRVSADRESFYSRSRHLRSRTLNATNLADNEVADDNVVNGYRAETDFRQLGSGELHDEGRYVSGRRYFVRREVEYITVSLHVSEEAEQGVHLILVEPMWHLYGVKVPAGWMHSCAIHVNSVGENVFVFGLNDFHGHLGNSLVDDGATGMLLAGRLAEESENRDSILVSAGDNVGASPFVSAIHHDVPSMMYLSTIGLQVSAVGNHEFDRGFMTLRTFIQSNSSVMKWRYLGGNVKLQVDPSNIPAADTTTLLGPTNVMRQAINPSFVWTSSQGYKIGFIGGVTDDVPHLVNPLRIGNLVFNKIFLRPVIEAMVEQKRQGRLNAIILLLHQGSIAGRVAQDLANPTEFRDFFKLVDTSDVAAVLTGHTHQNYLFNQAFPGGFKRPILQTGCYGHGFASFKLRFNNATRELVNVQAKVIDARISNPDEARKQIKKWYLKYPTVQAAKEIIQSALEGAEKLGRRPVGYIGGSFLTTAGYKESRLVDLIADALLNLHQSSQPQHGTPPAWEGLNETAVRSEQGDRQQLLGDDEVIRSDAQAIYSNHLLILTRDLGSVEADVAFMNPGGVRMPLIYNEERDGLLTFQDVQDALPFSNVLQFGLLNGSAILDVLEQQWFEVDYDSNLEDFNDELVEVIGEVQDPPEKVWGKTSVARALVEQKKKPRDIPVILGVAGMSYTFDVNRSLGARIMSVQIGGVDLDPAKTYMIAAPDFLAAGGDKFSAFSKIDNPMESNRTDADALREFIRQRRLIRPSDIQPRSRAIYWKDATKTMQFRQVHRTCGIFTLAITSPDILVPGPLHFYLSAQNDTHTHGDTNKTHEDTNKIHGDTNNTHGDTKFIEIPHEIEGDELKPRSTYLIDIPPDYWQEGEDEGDGRGGGDGDGGSSRKFFIFSDAYNDNVIPSGVEFDLPDHFVPKKCSWRRRVQSWAWRRRVQSSPVHHELTTGGSESSGGHELIGAFSVSFLMAAFVMVIAYT